VAKYADAMLEEEKKRFTTAPETRDNDVVVTCPTCKVPR
jgi:hypothetical protein